MKKCLPIIAILATTSAFAAPDKSFANKMKPQITQFCVSMFMEETQIDTKKVNEICGKVSTCVINNAPNNFALQNANYMQMSFLSCLADEANKLAQ